MKPHENFNLVDIEGEQWKDVIGYDGHYRISNMGRLKSLERYSSNGRIIKERILKVQYSNGKDVRCKYCLEGVCKRFNFHKQIALHFIQNYNDESIYLIDGNRYNSKPSNFILVNKNNVLSLYNKKSIIPPNKVSEMLHEMGYKKCSACKNILKKKILFQP